MRDSQRIYRTHGADWWDDPPRFVRLLRNLVPARMEYFREVAPPWEGRRVLDLGCAGGLMSEALAAEGARVLGVDPVLEPLAAGRRHAGEAFVEGRPRYAAARGEALPMAGSCCDVVVCVDVLEHVRSLEAVLDEVARVLRPGGCFLFDTVNRNRLARLLVITLAERVLRMLPRGTHEAERLIRPEELRGALEERRFRVGPFTGLGPVGVDRRLDLRFGRSSTTAVQYMGYAFKV